MSTVKIYEQQKELAIKAAVGVAIAIFCYTVMISPVFQDIASLHQSIRDSQQRRELYQKIRDLKQNLNNSERTLANITERSQLLGKISDIAGRTQLHVETLAPQTEPEGNYIRLRMDMDGQGTFFSLLKFLQAIEKIGPAIKVKDVTILWNPDPNPQARRYPLQIQLAFETLLKQRIKKENE